MQLQSIQRQIFEQNSLMASYQQQQQQQLTPAPSPAPSVVSNCSGTSSVAAMEQKVLTPVGPFSPQHHQQAVMDACSNAGLLVSTKKVTLDGVAFNNLSPLEEKTMDADKLILKQVVMDKPRAVSIIRYVIIHGLLLRANDYLQDNHLKVTDRFHSSIHELFLVWFSLGATR